MSSIIGQAMQGAGPTLGAIGSSLGSLLPSLGGAASQAAEAAASAPGGYGNLPSAVPTSVPSTDTFGLPTGWNPSMPAPGLGAGVGWGAGAPETPGDVMNTSLPASSAGAETPTSVMNTPSDGSAPPIDGAGGGGGMAAPYSSFAPGPTSPLNASAPALPGSPESVMGMNAGQASAAGAGDPADPSWWQNFKNSAFGKWLTGDTAAKGAFGTPLTALGTAGALAEAINRWHLQQTLQSPSALAGGAAGLYRPMSKAMRRSIIAPVTAAAQETGQINAPGLYAQSVATALAPYQYQMQMHALDEYIKSLTASEGAYPQGGLFGPAGLVPQGTYGGGGQTSSATS